MEPHVPVMAGDVMRLLDPRSSSSLVDLTVGAGGHAGEWLAASSPSAHLVGVDRDPDALAIAAETLAPFGDRVRLVRSDYASFLERHDELAPGFVPDAILLDAGVSSMQLDRPERGFSFREDEPLRMTMDPDAERTAADVVNTASLDDLTHAIGALGGEPRARRIAQAIVDRRRRRPFRTTGDLRVLVEEVLRRRGGRIHPATRTFQGLRMVVNDELGQLERALPLALDWLAPGGRMAVIAFHSGEDRLVKHAFRRAKRDGLGDVLTPKPLVADAEEIRTNRRSRSARLRAFERVGP